MRFTFYDDNNLQTHPREMKGWQESPAPGKKRVQYYGLVVSCLGMLLVSSLLNGEIVPRVFLPTLLILLLTMPMHELIHIPLKAVGVES